MANQAQSAGKDESIYFSLQANIGITKHMGGRKATNELMALCQIQEGQYVLEVGAGLGRTSCYIAKELGCRVVGVDLNERMVERAGERAKRLDLESKVEFRVADALELPFEDDLFDAVIDESVTAFVGEKQRAVNGYVRVAKPGGYVGLNEATWMNSPEPELVKYAFAIMSRAEFLTSDGWRGLLEGAGLRDITVSSYKFNVRSQYIEELKQLDFKEYIQAWRQFITQSVTNPVYRKFFWEVMSAPGNIFKFIRCIGYGIYVGRK
jgi:arsenite methyltransferase